MDKAKSWLSALGEVAIDWWDLPHHVAFFFDAEGWSYPHSKGVTTRVVLFDVSGNERGDAKQAGAWDDVEPGEQPGGGGGYQSRVKVKRLHILHSDCPCYHADETHPIRGAFEADQLGERCQHYRESLEKEVAEVFSFPNVTDVPDDLKGPDFTHQSRLKEGSKSRKCSPIRLAGVRDAAFRSLIHKFECRGMLKPSESERDARAFKVPKPGVNKRRLVIDYRYLNTCMSDDAHPLPVIEDLVAP